MLQRGLLQEYAQFLSILFRVIDGFLVLLAGWIAGLLWLGKASLLEHLNVLFFIALLTVLVFSFFRLYESVRTFTAWRYFSRLLQAWVTVLLLIMGLAFLTKTGESFSRGWFLLSSAFFLLELLFFRVGVLLLLKQMRVRGWDERRVVLFGSGETAYKLTTLIQRKTWTGFRLYKVFSDQVGVVNSGKIPVSPVPDDLDGWIADNLTKIDEIWLALPLEKMSRIREIINQLRQHTVLVRWAMDVFQLLGLSRYTVTDIDGFPMLNLNIQPISGIGRLVKSIEDRLLAAIIITLSLPLLLLIALLVRLTSKGPVFFRQQRHGWDGRIIKIYKFRTMLCHTEKGGCVTQARRRDKRITRFGSWLRRTSLDELPQLLNVLRGEMSIVGPRPHAVAHNVYYRDIITDYMQRHKVKPGITGWAQVNGWRGETDTLDKMKKRVEYDLYYIENWSLLFDFKIILLTAFLGFLNRNAY